MNIHRNWSLALLFGGLVISSVSPTFGQATEVRFIVGHADCTGATASFEFFINGTSVGTFSPTQCCCCNTGPLVVTLNDPGSLALVGPEGCTLFDMDLNDPSYNLALAYVRAEIDRSAGTETYCLVDYLPGGACTDRDLCTAYDWPGTSTYTGDLPDTDGDGDPDCSDPDDDDDGVPDGSDNCVFQPNPGQEDADGDAVGDACDDCPDVWNSDQADYDGDGLGDVCDNCPGALNPAQSDCDADGEGDACESNADDQDNDSDGVCNGVDNCPVTPNPGQADTDGDGTGDSCEPRPICVPWQPSNPSMPHYTYQGAVVTLKGIARGGPTEYRWDFGDGGGTAWTAVSDPYNLGVQHAYTGVVGQLYIATLYARDGAGNEAQDSYRVEIHESSDLSLPDHLDVRINMSIDEGLWWLHKNMIRGDYPAGSPGYGQPYGYWDPSYYPVGSVCTGVDAFQLHGSKANMDYDRDPYVETVQRGLNYLLHNTYGFHIGPQPAGDPDVNGNGIGLVANQSPDPADYRQTYLGGICMVALASSGAPNRVASLGRDHVYGRTYAAIVQDMVDFWSWGQVDGGPGRGGWRYYANFSDSDMSTAQWPPLGMLAAENNMAAIVPQFVRDELLLFLDATQNTALNNDHGAFGYEPYTAWYNVTKSAAGIICHQFLGTPLTDPKVLGAIGFIYRHWNDTGTSWDHTQLHGNSYGMYGVMKAFRLPEPDITAVMEYDYNAGIQTGNSFDWYYTPSGQSQQGLASYTVATQQADGSWDDTVGSNQVQDAFATGWRILVLLKGVTIIPPEAVVCDCDEQEYNLNQDIHLDASCSYHPDLTRSIVSYEWDFDYDGVFVADAAGVEASLPGGYPATGPYPVALRVTDDNPGYLGGPQSDVYVCVINVHEPPHCPHAFAGGPYIGWINEPLILDASASWDPDNEIVLYEWDLDNDGLYGAEDNDCFGEPSDALGVNPAWTWYTPYFGVIGLRVTDAEEEFPSCWDIDYSTVEIGNHAPVSDPNGPYVGSPGSTIVLDGTASYDPDPGDAITCAWDLDNDGDFDDAFDCQADFTLGQSIGLSYDICLKVTDNFGEYDIACTTALIIPNFPPVCDAGGPYAAECEGATTSLQLDGTGSSDPDYDPLTYAWTTDCPGGSFNDPTSPMPVLTVDSVAPCALSCSATLVVTDDDGAESVPPCTTTVTVSDTTGPSNVHLDGYPLVVAVDAWTTLEVAFTDDCGAPHAATWDFGDGTPVVVTDPVSSPTSASHAYTAQGIYTATVSIEDSCGNAASNSLVLVVFDPADGFTTGGGWFVPESDSFIDGVTVTDTVSKANFGFIVKYKRGADSPDGNLEFQYQAGDINLHSTDMDWLVIQSTTKVRFKGLATINGEGEYTFKVTAEDNGEPGINDTFKIEIWVGVVDTENVNPTPKHKAQGVLGGGNIQIHRK